jgi:hypothetical protein
MILAAGTRSKALAKAGLFAADVGAATASQVSAIHVHAHLARRLRRCLSMLVSGKESTQLVSCLLTSQDGLFFA